MSFPKLTEFLKYLELFSKSPLPRIPAIFDRCFIQLSQGVSLGLHCDFFLAALQSATQKHCNFNFLNKT